MRLFSYNDCDLYLSFSIWWWELYWFRGPRGWDLSVGPFNLTWLNIGMKKPWWKKRDWEINNDNYN